MTKKTYFVKHLCDNKKLEIDGRGLSSAWETAAVLSDFSFPWLDDSSPGTHFRSLWSDDHLYFCFEVSDENPVLADNVDPRERVLGSDRAEIFVSGLMS